MMNSVVKWKNLKIKSNIISFNRNQTKEKFLWPISILYWISKYWNRLQKKTSFCNANLHLSLKTFQVMKCSGTWGQEDGALRRKCSNIGKGDIPLDCPPQVQCNTLHHMRHFIHLSSSFFLSVKLSWQYLRRSCALHTFMCLILSV